MKRIIKAIVKSNIWYDNLPEPHRTIYGLGGLILTLIAAKMIDYIWMNKAPWAFIIWASVVAAWRCTSVFYHWRKDYLKRKNND